MGLPSAFRDLPRATAPYRPADARVRDYLEFAQPVTETHLQDQASRCMDCGVPFCMGGSGCPLDNAMPEWNHLVYEGRWEEAYEVISRTNNFPEFTGRVCLALCEGACSAQLFEESVTIRNLEQSIVDYAWDRGWVTPQPPLERTGKRVAIVGSGPAGLAAAQQLNRAGHHVTVYERHDRPGGLLTYGIPNMKLDKRLVQRRVRQLLEEGVRIVTRAWIGGQEDHPAGAAPRDPKVRVVDPQELLDTYDAVLLATGSTRPRDLPAPGRHLAGIHFAMDFLHGNTRALLNAGQVDAVDPEYARPIDAAGRHVVVIGGGDTGNDCLGTALRQSCASVANFELLDLPPEHRAKGNEWPLWPRTLKTDYGHQEAAAVHGKDPRRYATLTKAFLGFAGKLRAVRTVQVDWSKPGDQAPFSEVPNSENDVPADLVLLAMGFLGPEAGVGEKLGVETDARGNFKAEYGQHRTNVDKVFVAGDCRRGQSLVAWAIGEGRHAARAIDFHLMGESDLDTPSVMHASLSIAAT
ncbi:MAG: glutamate synthase subunit beta [Planctomycetota bacterium]